MRTMNPMAHKAFNVDYVVVYAAALTVSRFCQDLQRLKRADPNGGKMQTLGRAKIQVCNYILNCICCV